MDARTFANCLTLWLCCLQPIFMFWLGWRIASAGGVGPFIASVRERAGQAANERPATGKAASPAARDESLY